MKKKTKYVLCLNWLLFPLALIGCANVSYIRYTDGTLTEKERNAPFVLYAEAPNDMQYTVIGSLTVEGGSGILTQMSITEIQKRFVKEALKRGADGAINVAIYSYNTRRGLTTPGYTEYETITSYHSGNIYMEIFKATIAVRLLAKYQYITHPIQLTMMYK